MMVCCDRFFYFGIVQCYISEYFGVVYCCVFGLGVMLLCGDFVNLCWVNVYQEEGVGVLYIVVFWSGVQVRDIERRSQWVRSRRQGSSGFLRIKEAVGLEKVGFNYIYNIVVERIYRVKGGGIEVGRFRLLFRVAQVEVGRQRVEVLGRKTQDSSCGCWQSSLVGFQVRIRFFIRWLEQGQGVFRDLVVFRLGRLGGGDRVGVG